MNHTCRWLDLCALAMSLLLAGCGGGDSDEAPPDQPVPSGGDTFTVSGTVSGLTQGEVVLRLYEFQGPESQVLRVGNGDFTFALPYPDGTSLEFSHEEVVSDEPQRCVIEPRMVTIDGANAHVEVTCRPAKWVGGTVTGLKAERLQLNMWHGTEDDSMLLLSNIDANGPYRFGKALLPGEAYEISVPTQPDTPPQRCLVSNPRGVMGEVEVTNVNVDCGDTQIAYKVDGLVGEQIVVALHIESTVNGVTAMLEVERQVRVADGDYVFETLLDFDDPYEVRVAEQPRAPDQLCHVERGTGVVAPGMDDVLVKCPDPLRRWRFDDEFTRRQLEPKFPPPGELRRGVVDAYQLMGDGPAIPLGSVSGLDTEELFRLYLDGPGAGGHVFSNRSGRTFWVATESPAGQFLGVVNRPHSNFVKLETLWRFRKVSQTTRLALEVTALNMLAFDDSSAAHGPGRLWTGGDISVQAHHVEGDESSALPFFTAQGGMFLKGERHASGMLGTEWKLIPKIHSDAMLSLWREEDFGVDISADFRVAYASLLEEKPLEIDLSEVAVGSDFLVKAVAWVEARNNYSAEGGSAAFLRDPASFEAGEPPGGMSLAITEGVVMVDIGAPPIDDLVFRAPAAPECPADAAHDTLQLEAGPITVDEGTNYSAGVRVTRTGGFDGLINARVRLVPGTADADTDFETRDIEVSFGDGSGEPRTIELPIVDDELVEGVETLTVVLDEPVGCAVIGARDSVQVQIEDNDLPAVEEYTLGGTVDGLEGTGLTLTNLSTDATPIVANGAFAFARTFAQGVRYEVRVATQPGSPDQSCSVANGSGIFDGASVSDIVVTCTTVGGGEGLDPGFGGDGRVNALLSAATDVTVQADGSIVAVGEEWIARFDAAGEPDTDFGTGGVVPVQFHGGSGSDWLTSVAVQPDGRIVVAGHTREGVNSPTQEDLVVARFEASGAVDAGFGNGGRVITDVDSRGDGAYDLLLQSDGGILVIGSASVQDPFGVSDADYVVLRFTDSGVLDTSFGTGGIVNTDVGGRVDLAHAAALQADGKIVLAGRVAPSGGADPDIGLVRYLPDGTLDASFGNDGIVRDATPIWDEAADVVVQPDGAILVSGWSDSAGARGLLLARYTATGEPDVSFDADGRVGSAAMRVGSAVTLLPDGRILAGGDVDGDFALARFSAAGALDTGFGTNGVLRVDFFGDTDSIAAMAMQPDGRIVAAGGARNGTATNLGLVRVLP